MCTNPTFLRPRENEAWFSATQTHDFFLGDPLLSFLKSKQSNAIPVNNNNNPNIQNFIMQQGNIFEENIMKRIRSKFGKNSVVTVANDSGDAFSDRKAMETFKLMKKGVPVIYSGVVQNPINNTFGIPDLLVRYDYLSKFIKDVPALEKAHSPKLGKDWFYVVIDIKYSSLKLAADGIHLLNAGRTPAYKAQLLVYNLALEYMQGYLPPCSYIIGRKWSYICKGLIYEGIDPLDKLGVIDYCNYDSSYPQKLEDCLEWLKLIQSEESKDWDIFQYPLPHNNLYPNMNNKYDHPWRNLKEQISQKNGEITAVWMMGPKNRKHALEQGVCSWKNKKCNSDTLNVSGKNRSYIVDQILNINRQKRRKILPDKLIDNKEPWLKQAKLEFFVDFETWNGAMADIHENTFANKDQLCYLIGVSDNYGKYKRFVADFLTPQNEGHMCREFVKYVRNRIDKLNLTESEVNIYHWSKAEQIWWNNLQSKHHCKLYCNWIDLLEIFQEEPIVIKGALTYSLKDIAKAMYNNKMIKSTWNTDIDAITTMILIQEANDYAKRNRSSIISTDELKKITEYNKTDVIVLLEILNYLRNKYS